MDTNDTRTATASRSMGLVYLAGAVAVFVICSIVQAAGDSTMFSTSYAEPDSAVLDVLMNVTFFPGWILTAGLVLAALKAFFSND
jgi:hypothetical protein